MTENMAVLALIKMYFDVSIANITPARKKVTRLLRHVSNVPTRPDTLESLQNARQFGKRAPMRMPLS